jgi:glyoxylase-like metal-dependent hydrolase (beta-lactamase superfamily II)
MDVTNVTADADVFTCNAYLVDGDRSTLVDAGAVEGVADELRARVDALDAVVLTHQHGDHVEALPEVLAAFDPDVYARDDHPARTHAVEDGDEVPIGDECFEAVSTPGHAADHLAFVSSGTLFSGDAVVYSDGAFDDGSFGRTDRPGQSRDRLIAGIERLLDRLPGGVGQLYAGHGEPFHGDVRAVVERALQRAERREPKY